MNKDKVIRLFNIYGFDGGNYDGNVYDITGCSSVITTKGGSKNLIIVKNKQEKDMELKKEISLPKELEGKKFRIRKLTPRECGRLQDVDDSDIDKIESTGLSNSAMYKLYGNSITVNVLFHLFRKLFIETENENQQLRLF